MAQMMLGTVGQAIGGPVGAVIGATLGRVVDQWVVAGLEPARQRGPRLEALRVQGSAEGAPMACVFGRARVTGQVIWAARFLEGRQTSSAGKGRPRTAEYDYSLSFAVALCEGEIDGIGRVWADGQPMDLSGVTMRVHRGGAGQTPDPLIEAVEGAAPAYRGTAYAVFEDLPLGPYGNRPPQLAFEVFRRARGTEERLEDRLEGVCLIPGAGEFVLATEAVTRRVGLTRTSPENLHFGDGRSDLLVPGASGWLVCRSLGTTLESCRSTGMASVAAAGPPVVLDANGDGLTDVVHDNSGLRFRAHDVGAPDLLASAVDGHGVRADFEFATLARADVHTVRRVSTYPVVDYSVPALVATSLLDGAQVASPGRFRYPASTSLRRPA